MRTIIYLIVCMPILLLTACDVHEVPEAPELVKLHLRLKYETDMTKWEHLYDGSSIIEQGLGDTYDNHRNYGEIRYIVRTYPISEKMRSASDYTQEFVFTKNISEGYDHEVTLDMLPGDYNVMVWSDLVQHSGDTPFYDVTNFYRIKLQGDYKGNNDYRDAFRGTNSVSVVADIMKRLPDTLDVAMQRPFAKFEFVTNDVVEFIDKEYIRIASKANENNDESIDDDAPTRAINIEDYKVVFSYVSYMSDEFSIPDNIPNGAAETVVMFESSLRTLSDSEASLGFDYVFVNGKESTISVQIGIYDNEGTQCSLTKPIEVPIKRNRHTVMTGKFLMSKASGGVTINPSFEDDINRYFP